MKREYSKALPLRIWGRMRLLLALIEFDQAYKSFLVCNTEEYYGIGWGQY